MKLGALLKQIPIYQEIILMEKNSEISKGHPGHDDINRYKDKTVGLISVDGNKLKINVYVR